MRPSDPSRRCAGRALPLLLLVVLALAGAPAAADGPAPGASVEELLALGRQLSPAIAAAALDVEAAMARADAAGRWPDPMFTTEFEDIRGTGSDETYVPETLGRVKYSIAQTIPLWGKTDLERKVARAEVRVAEQQLRDVETQLAARIKTVFAEGYAAEERLRLSRELLRSVDAIAAVAQSRYGQGRGGQQDVVSAEQEKGRLQFDLARQEAQRQSAMARMNALLNRPAGAPLARAQALRPVPPADALPLDELLQRARDSNPRLSAEQAEIVALERGAELVRRTWYPDVTLGLSVFDEDGNDAREFGGYEAMLSVDVPLQWGVRRARERDAKARLAASRARREATAADLRGEIETAWWALEAARRGERVLREVNVPQASVMLDSALVGYELGRSDLPGVLLAEQGLRRTGLELIEVQLEQQMRLAELERLVGEDR